MPQARDEDDLAEILATTDEPLEPLAGGSKRAIGRPVAAEPLDLGLLRGIVEYEPEELVISARAATPLDEVEAALRERGQRLAFEPPDWSALLSARQPGAATGATGAIGVTLATAVPARPTIGGVLATNASGSRRIAAGAARDHFLGFRAVSGRAERFRGGGRVVKNVTGYDLPKLLAGSWGTLAVLTEVTVRAHPLPEHERTLVLGLRDPEAAVQAMSAALGSACEVSSAAFAPGMGAALRLEGFVPSVEARSRALVATLREGCDGAGPATPEGIAWLDGEDSRRLWREVGAVKALAIHPVVWRLSVAPSDAPAIIRLLEPADYLLDWGGGLVWIGAELAEPERVRSVVSQGHATLFKAPPAIRASMPVFHPLPAPLAAVIARLKAAFDPHDRLNPGRMS